MTRLTTKHTFWVRYFEPKGIPDEHKAERWPNGMKGWISGYSFEGHTIWCARVDAKDENAAMAVVRKCYGKSAKQIMFDSCEPKELGWRPTGGRFPE